MNHYLEMINAMHYEVIVKSIELSQLLSTHGKLNLFGKVVYNAIKIPADYVEDNRYNALENCVD